MTLPPSKGYPHRFSLAGLPEQEQTSVPWGSLASPLTDLRLLAGGNPGQAQAEEAVPVRRRGRVAGRRLAVPGAAFPAAVPAHPLRGPVGVLLFVGAPLPDIAVHVVQAQTV